MSFYNVVQKYKDFDFASFFANITDQDVRRTLQKERLTSSDFLTLLSDKVQNHLEAMAQRAHQETLRNFGRVIFLYTPIYIADYCTNQCVYCGFKHSNDIPRKKLSLEEVEKEAQVISATGLRHILVLTGESRTHSPVSYIKECVQVLAKYFTSVSIEVYPLEEAEYRELVEAGVDGVTVYQEVYNEEIYQEVHPKGPKSIYSFRLDTPERACKAGMRTVNIGALLGLDDWRKEAFFTGAHADYLQNLYTDVEVGVSFPRLRPHLGSYQPNSPVGDKELVQILLATRLFLPRAGINISTRESEWFRDNLINLGVTKMSAGSSTVVGGHSVAKERVGQFEISDTRDVEEMRQVILSKGYQPVFKDWQAI